MNRKEVIKVFGSERKKRSLEEKIDHAIASRQMYIYWDGNGFVFVSKPLRRLLGYRDAKMFQGKGIGLLLASEEEKSKLCLNGSREASIPKIALKSVADEIVYFKGTVEKIGELTLLSIFDITGEVKRESSLLSQILTDPLTNLSNRSGFNIAATMRLETAKRGGVALFLLVADIDKFKWLNDRVGDQVGDLALEVVANALKEAFHRVTDIIARPYGDTFFILVDAKGFCLEERERAFRGFLEGSWGPSLVQFTKIEVVFPVSVTFGMSYFDPTKPCSLEQLIKWGIEDLKIMKKNSKT